jgi:hypothetical protein
MAWNIACHATVSARVWPPRHGRTLAFFRSRGLSTASAAQKALEDLVNGNAGSGGGGGGGVTAPEVVGDFDYGAGAFPVDAVVRFPNGTEIPIGGMDANAAIDAINKATGIIDADKQLAIDAINISAADLYLPNSFMTGPDPSKPGVDVSGMTVHDAGVEVAKHNDVVFKQIEANRKQFEEGILNNKLSFEDSIRGTGVLDLVFNPTHTVADGIAAFNKHVIAKCQKVTNEVRKYRLFHLYAIAARLLNLSLHDTIVALAPHVYSRNHPGKSAKIMPS